MSREAPEHPREAGKPRVVGPTRTYENEEIRVLWDSTRCTHVAECLRALPQVFDVTARPWVEVDGAPADAIAKAVRLCPTGALRYESKSPSVPEEAPDNPPSVEVCPNGPLLVRGRVQVTSPGGKVVADEARLALCRCGASQNKPFCDNSHRLVGFRG